MVLTHTKFTATELSSVMPVRILMRHEEADPSEDITFSHYISLDFCWL